MKKILMFCLSILLTCYCFAQDIELINVSEIKKGGKPYIFYEGKVEKNHSWEGDYWPKGIYYVKKDFIIIGGVNEIVIVNEKSEIIKSIPIEESINPCSFLWADSSYILYLHYNYDDPELVLCDINGKILDTRRNCIIDKVENNDGIIIQYYNYSWSEDDNKSMYYTIKINFESGKFVQLSKIEKDQPENNRAPDYIIKDKKSKNKYIQVNYHSPSIDIYELKDEPDYPSGIFRKIYSLAYPIDLDETDKEYKYSTSVCYDENEKMIYIFFGDREKYDANKHGKYYLLKVKDNLNSK